MGGAVIKLNKNNELQVEARNIKLLNQWLMINLARCAGVVRASR